jgi:hypothetical protein
MSFTLSLAFIVCRNKALAFEMTETEKECTNAVLISICATYIVVALFYSFALCMLSKEVEEKIEALEEKVVYKLNILLQRESCQGRERQLSSSRPINRESPPPTYESSLVR